MAQTFGWLEVELIADLLHEHHPAIDPRGISFTLLKKLISELPDFKEEAGHPCNEKILETVQGNWIELSEGKPPEED